MLQFIFRCLILAPVDNALANMGDVWLLLFHQGPFSLKVTTVEVSKGLLSVALQFVDKIKRWEYNNLLDLFKGPIQQRTTAVDVIQ